MRLALTGGAFSYPRPARPADPIRTHTLKAQSASKADGAGGRRKNRMSRIRKRILLERALAVSESEFVADPLSIEIHELLYAFDLAASHVKKGGSYASRLAEQQELALGLIDWAICQTDRGEGLLKAMTRPDELARR